MNHRQVVLVPSETQTWSVHSPTCDELGVHENTPVEASIVALAGALDSQNVRP
jgi:hypothetical protein